MARETRISINEMVPSSSNFDPSVHIFYFANLERAAVDSACHSCWAEECPVGGTPPCFNCAQADAAGVHGGQSLDGLLTVDSASPRSVWWAYKAYAALNGTLLKVNASTAAGLGGVDGVASLSEDGKSLAAVVGKIGDTTTTPTTGAGSNGGGGGGSSNGRIVFHNVPSSVLNDGSDGGGGRGSTATAAVATIPNTGKAAAGVPTVTAGTAKVLPSSSSLAAPTATSATTVEKQSLSLLARRRSP